MMRALTMLKGLVFLKSLSPLVKLSRKRKETYASNLLQNGSVGIVLGLQSRAMVCCQHCSQSALRFLIKRLYIPLF